jgi:hypothetical protein
MFSECSLKHFNLPWMFPEAPQCSDNTWIKLLKDYKYKESLVQCVIICNILLRIHNI